MFWMTTLPLKSLLLLAGVGAISGSGLLLMIRASLATAGERLGGVVRLLLVLLALAGGFYSCHVVTGQHLGAVVRR